MCWADPWLWYPPHSVRRRSVLEEIGSQQQKCVPKVFHEVGIWNIIYLWNCERMNRILKINYKRYYNQVHWVVQLRIHQRIFISNSYFSINFRLKAFALPRPWSRSLRKWNHGRSSDRRAAVNRGCHRDAISAIRITNSIYFIALTAITRWWKCRGNKKSPRAKYPLKTDIVNQWEHFINNLIFELMKF